MAARRRGVRLNLSISRELKERMDAVSQSVNWSQTAAEAFERTAQEHELTIMTG